MAGLGVGERLGVGVPGDWFGAGLVFGEFVAIGTPLEEDGFTVPGAAVSLVGGELLRTEVEDA